MCFLRKEPYKMSNEAKPLNSKMSFDEFKLNSDGMLTVVVQDYKTNEVLMVAYMTKEAYDKTIKTGIMTYYSRSRNELWIKGETSGHYQYVKDLYIDCERYFTCQSKADRSCLPYRKLFLFLHRFIRNRGLRCNLCEKIFVFLSSIWYNRLYKIRRQDYDSIFIRISLLCIEVCDSLCMLRGRNLFRNWSCKSKEERSIRSYMIRRRSFSCMRIQAHAAKKP